MPHEVLFQMDDFRLVDGLPMDWTDMNAVAERIETEYPTMIALSVLTNTTSEVREALRNEKMQKILHSNYKMSRFGRYYVWERGYNKE